MKINGKEIRIEVKGAKSPEEAKKIALEKAKKEIDKMFDEISCEHNEGNFMLDVNYKNGSLVAETRVHGNTKDILLAFGPAAYRFIQSLTGMDKSSAKEYFKALSDNINEGEFDDFEEEEIDG